MKKIKKIMNKKILIKVLKRTSLILFTVIALFMKSPKNEIIEIHEDRERNFYLEQGYEMLSVGLIDGYFRINDVVSLEKELGIK